MERSTLFSKLLQDLSVFEYVLSSRISVATLMLTPKLSVTTKDTEFCSLILKASGTAADKERFDGLGFAVKLKREIGYPKLCLF